MTDYRIVWLLEHAGFDLVSGAGLPLINSSRYADSIVSQIHRLTAGGVPPQNIAVLADYRSSAVEMLVSARLADREIRYILVAGCTKAVAKLPTPRLHGRILSIVDRTDSLDTSCKSVLGRSQESDKSSELVLDTGLGYRAFFRPSDVWMRPAVEWAIFAR